MSTVRKESHGAVLHVVALVGDAGQFGGPTTVAVGMVSELASRALPVGFLALRQGRVLRPLGLPRGSWRTFPARRFVPRTGMLGLLNLRLVWALWREMGVAKVAHVHAGRDLVSLSALAIARLRHVPVVAQTHGMVLPRKNWTARLFDTAFLRLLRSAVVLYLTPDERDDLRRQLGPDADLRFLGNGLPRAQLTEVSERALPPRVVFASRLHPVKRVDLFADAARQLVTEGFDADFIVYGPDQGDLRLLMESVRDPALQGRLRYGGSLDHARTLRALTAATVVVLPSAADWMPMTLLEAMAAGVPTVSTWSCGLADAIVASEAGLVVEGSAQAVAGAIRQLLTDNDLAARLGRQARELVREQFLVEQVADQLLEIYADM